MSSVVMASTKVDLPEPMSPVSSALRPPRTSVQTRLSKVPQLNTSRRSRRKPTRLSSATKSRPSTRGSFIVRSFNRRLAPGELALVGRQPCIEFGQPLRVDEGLEDPAHFEARRTAGSFQPAQESEVRYPVD